MSRGRRFPAGQPTNSQLPRQQLRMTQFRVARDLQKKPGGYAKRFLTVCRA